MNDYQPKAPRERILAATLDLVEKQGPRRATTRSIAAAAGVNVAAINYYYRSKEALLEAALASSWEHALAHLREFLYREPWSPRAVLTDIALFLMEGGYRYPAVSRATIFGGNGEPRPVVAASFAALARDIATRLTGRNDEDAEAAAVLLRVGAFLSALIFPSLASACVPWLDEEEARREYATALSEELAGWAERRAGADASLTLACCLFELLQRWEGRNWCGPKQQPSNPGSRFM